MRRLQGKDDTLVTREKLHRFQGLRVPRGREPDPARLTVMGKLRADAGVVKPGGDGMRRQELAILIRQEEGLVALRDPGPPPAVHPCRVLSHGAPAPPRLDADELGGRALQKR